MNIKIISIEALLLDISTFSENQTLIKGWEVSYEVNNPIYLRGRLKIDTISFSPRYNDLIDLIEQSLKNAIT